MDFWDLTVLIFRRWMVALPLLLLSGGATAYIAVTAKPDYTMTSYVQLIPPRPAAGEDPTSASMRNPWNQVGLNTLGQAAIYSTQDQQFVDNLTARGHTDNFTLTITYPNPIVTVEVVGRSRDDARETTRLVMNQLRQSVATLQRESGVGLSDAIATQRLDRGQNLLPSRSRVKRAVLAVAAAGLVMTAGCTVAFDALLRRRTRRRAGVKPSTTTSNRAEPAAPAPAVPSAAPARTSPARRTVVRQRTARVVHRGP